MITITCTGDTTAGAIAQLLTNLGHGHGCWTSFNIKSVERSQDKDGRKGWDLIITLEEV